MAGCKVPLLHVIGLKTVAQLPGKATDAVFHAFTVAPFGKVLPEINGWQQSAMPHWLTTQLENWALPVTKTVFLHCRLSLTHGVPQVAVAVV